MKLIISIAWLFFLSSNQLFGQTRLPKRLLWEQIETNVPLSVKNKRKIELKKNTAFVFLSPECPLCKNYIPVLNTLAKRYPSVNIIGIIPGKGYTVDEIKSYLKNYDILFDVYLDKNKFLTNALDAKVTPETILVDHNGSIRYRGLIDNWQAKLGVKRKVITEHYLDDALNQINAPGYKYMETAPLGCLINDL
ncbi:redoxin domain-containing protein [Pedobacter suwonensis]|jgi:thiol-disulfide isomerase/thioredoxin|uniref:redoxin domain-containing protein n=1 Tax=Pedobacter suwonensis TaxID=332999 RepID=UPI0011A5432B|nr:redoxin domain-containing protein [Pedobacter suwonensis]